MQVWVVPRMRSANSPYIHYCLLDKSIILDAATFGD
jgi:hypothetical protein